MSVVALRCLKSEREVESSADYDNLNPTTKSISLLGNSPVGIHLKISHVVYSSDKTKSDNSVYRLNAWLTGVLNELLYIAK